MKCAASTFLAEYDSLPFPSFPFLIYPIPTTHYLNLSSVSSSTYPSNHTLTFLLSTCQTKLSLMGYAMYRSEHNFKQADAFVPERWLSWNGYDDRSAYEPFSLGPRNCIGKNLAQAELKIILARTIFNFDFALPADRRKHDGDNKMGWRWDDQRIYMLWQCEPMVVQVADARRREEGAVATPLVEKEGVSE